MVFASSTQSSSGHIRTTPSFNSGFLGKSFKFQVSKPTGCCNWCRRAKADAAAANTTSVTRDVVAIEDAGRRKKLQLVAMALAKRSKAVHQSLVGQCDGRKADYNRQVGYKGQAEFQLRVAELAREWDPKQLILGAMWMGGDGLSDFTNHCSRVMAFCEGLNDEPAYYEVEWTDKDHAMLQEMLKMDCDGDMKRVNAGLKLVEKHYLIQRA